MLARQTPVFDSMFLEDFKPLDSAVMGRHLTEKWDQGSGDTHFYDKVEIGQPNLTKGWQRISSGECDASCSPPEVNVSWGTTRNSYFMEQFRIKSPLMCLTQLRYSTSPGEQIAKIYKGLKKFPEMYNSDFLRVHAFDRNPLVQICGKDFQTFVPDITNDVGPVSNVSPQLTTINLGSDALLPTSALTFNYLDYLSTQLDLDGYAEGGSGLPAGMFNLITDKRTWFLLTNGNPSMKDMMALGDPQSASALYKIGQGINKPFGNYAPTIDTQPIRFQKLATGILNRVFPYYNTASDTGFKRVKNPAYINARYQLSYLWHPKAIKLFTPDFKKMHEKVPTVNSAMYGQWMLVNPQGLIQYEMPDGTTCTKNNDEQLWFYWKVALELGFKFEYPEWIMPILHLVDGSGKDGTVDEPVCGTAPQYVAQTYSDNPQVCEA